MTSLQHKHIPFLHRIDFSLVNGCHHMRLLFVSSGHIMPLLKLSHVTRIFVLEAYTFEVPF